MDQTDHHLLVGKGAQDFARSMGFTIEDDLNTENSRKLWLEWKRRTDPEHYLDAEGARRPRYARRGAGRWSREGLIDREHYYGTINCDGINAEGRDLRRDDDERARLEDSRPRRRLADSRRRPLRRRRGRRRRLDRAAARRISTTCRSFLIVEEMRRGVHPKDAGMEALKRIATNTVEKRLLNGKGQPNFDLNFYCLNAKGEYAGVVDVRVDVRRVHRERRADAQDRRAVRGTSRTVDVSS